MPAVPRFDGTDQHSRYEEADDESADVGEESDTAATGVLLDRRVVAFEELAPRRELGRRDNARHVRVSHMLRPAFHRRLLLYHRSVSESPSRAEISRTTV